MSSSHIMFITHGHMTRHSMYVLILDNRQSQVHFRLTYAANPYSYSTGMSGCRFVSGFRYQSVNI